MNSSKKFRVFLVATAIMVFTLILLSIFFFGNHENKDKTIIGFIMSGSIQEQGWNGMHYKGVTEAGDELGVEISVKENIKEFTGECEIAIRELVDAGAGMIILSSYGYSEEVRDVVKEYPDIVFYANSPDYHEENMTSYFVRMYQARYLSGILAGMQTTTNHIGYVAAMSNNEVNRGINAFTLGVRSVNPEADVIVTWTGNWDDKEAEIKAVENLVEENVDVITYHQNQSYVIEAAEAAGICSIGYHQVAEGFSDNYLTTVACDWKQTYMQLIREFLQGNGNLQSNFWIGIDQEAVELTEYSSLVTEQQKEAIEEAKKELLSGKDVFSDVIYDMSGTLRCAENENISDEILLQELDWFVEGIRFYEE